MFKKFVRTVTAIVFSVAMVVSVSACSTADRDNAVKIQVVDFYSEYVAESTSIDNAAINAAYSELSLQNFEGQNTNIARDAIFARFYKVDNKLFDKLAVEYATYDEVGITFTNALLMSLATQAQSVIVEIPTDAVTVTHDDSLNLTVYEIDRSKITAPLPLFAKSKVTDLGRETLIHPVRVIKDGADWKVIPDSFSLNEIGIPNEK